MSASLRLWFFNLPVQLCVAIESAVSLRLGKYFQLGVWSKTSDLTAATLSAFALGSIFAYLANGDRCHRIARHLKITRETSYPSEWFGTFAENQRTLVVLHLKDERRLYGWPDEWPSSPSVGHFRLSSPSWLVDGKDIPIQGARYILLNVKDVKWVEFIDKPPEVINVQERAESTPDADRSGA